MSIIFDNTVNYPTFENWLQNNNLRIKFDYCEVGRLSAEIIDEFDAVVSGVNYMLERETLSVYDKGNKSACIVALAALIVKGGYRHMSVAGKNIPRPNAFPPLDTKKILDL